MEGGEEEDEVKRGEEEGGEGWYGEWGDAVVREGREEGEEVKLAEEAAECGAYDEAEADTCACDGHAFDAFITGSDIGDSGGGDGDITGEDACGDADEEEEFEFVGEDPEEVAEGGAAYGDDEDIFSTEFIG